MENIKEKLCTRLIVSHLNVSMQSTFAPNDLCWYIFAIVTRL